MSSICIVVLFHVALINEFYVFCGLLPENNLYRLDIVHYNDFHARFEETSVPFPICLTNDTSCLGGFARLYHEVLTLMKEKPDALLLDAGDVFQGTYWYTLLKWDITQEFINMLPNDAHALGNHDFDDGIAGVVPYLKSLKAPVIAANMNTSDEPSMDGLIKPHVVVKRKGRRIGIIGLMTPTTMQSSDMRSITIKDPIEVARKEADVLKQSGIDIIIVLSHCGLNVDIEIGKKAGEYIDLIVGGHSHSLLWNGTSPSNESASGPYPVMVESEAKPDHKVLIVAASAFSKYLGNLTLFFDDNGDIRHFDGTPIFLNRSIPEDPGIKALLQPYTEELHSYVEKVVGYSTDDLLLDKCGSEECYLGNLVADSFLYATKQINISNLPHVSIILRNNIRGSLSKGEITRGMIINALPLTNNVTTFIIKGKYLIAILDHTLTEVWEKKPFEGPWLPHVAGMRVVLNAEEGRATSVLVKEGDGDDYKALAPEDEYQVTMLSFVTKGGNGFQAIRNFGSNFTTVCGDSEALENYITTFSPFTPVLEKRLTVLS